MKYLKNIFYIMSLLIVVVSCEDFSTDLEVENLENPNDKILTSDPVALTATAGTIIQNWFMTTHSYNGLVQHLLQWQIYHLVHGGILE